MKSIEQRIKLLKKCIEIKDSINQMIPLAANRYEEFEQIDRIKMKAYEQDRRARTPEDEQLESCVYEMEFLDAHDKRYEEYENYVKQKQIEYHIFEFINERFKEFCFEMHVESPHNLDDTQKQNFKQILLRQSSTLCEQIARAEKLLGGGTRVVDVSKMDDYLETNADNFIQVLTQGLTLTVNDEELAYRFKKILNWLNIETPLTSNFTGKMLFFSKRGVIKRF